MKKIKKIVKRFLSGNNVILMTPTGCIPYYNNINNIN